MAKLTKQSIVAAGITAFLITGVQDIIVGTPFGFWLEWAGWFSVMLIVYRRL